MPRKQISDKNFPPNHENAIFLKIVLGTLLGLIVGFSTIQLLYYFEYGQIMSLREGAHINLSAQDLVILLYTGIAGIYGGLFFSIGDTLRSQREHILSLEQEAKMESKLLGFAAHALRTPATSFKWALQGIIKGDYGTLRQEQKRILKSMYHNAETLLSLVDDYVDIANFALNKLEVSLKKVVVSSIEEEIRKELKAQRSLAEAKKVNMTYTSSISKTQKKQMALLDIPRLMRVFENLVENAIDYTPKGGNVRIETSVIASTLLFKVSDTGIGIREEDKTRIFTEFFRSSNARKFKSTGSGIGLYLATMIIMAHGGKIWFDSTENKGSTFYFQIPLYRQTSEEVLQEFLRKV